MYLIILMKNLYYILKYKDFHFESFIQLLLMYLFYIESYLSLKQFKFKKSKLRTALFYRKPKLTTY